jgi:hypothetical protein
MARLVQAINSSSCAATDGLDKPGHDDAGTSPAVRQTPDFAIHDLALMQPVSAMMQTAPVNPALGM